jgi:glycosyltransferase involved in cell wall biosynthesis
MKTKIVHVVYQFHPDMGYDSNLFARFAHPQLEVVILTSDNLDLWNVTAKDVQTADSRIEEQYGVEIIRLGSFKTGKKKAGVFMKGLNRKIEEINPEIVFYHGLESPTYAWSIIRQIGKRFITADTHTLFSQFKDVTFIGGIYLNLIFKPLIVNRLKKINAPMFYTALENKKVLQWFGFEENQIFDNEICTDVELFRKEEIQFKDFLPQTNFQGKVLLYTGKFDHFKQPDIILDAIRTIEDQIDFPLDLVFVGPKNEEYQNRHFKRTFSNELIQIHLLGPAKNHELYQYYSAADIAVFPKQNTLSSLDAQACGLPVIMERDETNEERLKEGGLCYEPENVSDLGAQILKLLKDETLVKTLSENGRNYMHERYNYKKKMTDIQEMLLQQYLETQKA